MIKNIVIFLDFIKKLLIRDRSMIYTMALRDLRARYVGSFFGFFWAVLNPLFELAIFGLVFGFLLKAKPDPSSGTDSYFIFLLCGLVPWLFFSQTLVGSANVLISNANFIKKSVGFPSEVLPIVKILSNIIAHLIAMGVLLVVLLIFEGGLTLQTPLVLIYLFLAAVFATGLGWIIASLNIYLRDVAQVVAVLNRAWFYFTPIVYTTKVVGPKGLFIMKLNPMFHVVEGYRSLILKGTFPPFKELVFLIIVSFLTFAIGGLLFKRLKPGFAEVL